jgi:hypothetical protein
MRSEGMSVSCDRSRSAARPGRVGGVIALALLFLGCWSGKEARVEAEGSGGASACEPVAEMPEVRIEAASLVGRHRLVLVATSGPAAGGTVEERLRLWVQDPDLEALVGPGGEEIPGVRQRLVGTLTGTLAEVGARLPGDLASERPEAPGVAVLFTAPDVPDGATAERVLLRLGSEANVRGRLAFDDAFTVLRVTAADERGFFGSWESGSGLQGAGGYFCAMPG